MSDQQQPSPADTAMCGRCGHVAFWHANFGRGNCQVIAGCDCHEFKMSAQPSPARVKQLENAVDAADRVMAGHIEATLPAAAWRAWRREHRDALCEAQPSPAVPPEGEDDERLKVIRGTIDRLASANTDVSRQYIADVSFLMGRLAQTRLQHAEQIAEKDRIIAEREDELSDAYRHAVAQNQQLAALREELDKLRAVDVPRLLKQAQDASLTLSEAGCRAMPLLDGVRWLVDHNLRLRADLAHARAAQQEAEGDARTLRGYINTYGETPTMTASNRDHWKNRAEQAESSLAQARQEIERIRQAFNLERVAAALSSAPAEKE